VAATEESPAAAYPPKFERQDIDGVKVLTDEVYESPLSKHVGKFIPVHGVRVLTLEDETIVYGCADCEFAGTLGQVRQHRGSDHGVSMGGNPRRRRHKSAADAEAAGDTDEQLVLPRETLSMTLHDFLQTATLLDQWGSVLEGLEKRVEELVEENAELRVNLRNVTKDRDGIRRKVARAMGLEVITTEE
jgi:hypothetical protein